MLPMKISILIYISILGVSLALFFQHSDAFCLYRDTGYNEKKNGRAFCCQGNPAVWPEENCPVPVSFSKDYPQDKIKDIQRAIQVWNQIPSSTFAMTLRSDPETEDTTKPGSVLIVWGDTAMAATACQFENAFTKAHQIKKCRVTVSKKYPWNNRNDEHFKALVHEFGHVLGIVHTDVLYTAGCGNAFGHATMDGDGGQRNAGTLEIDDMAAATALYPVWSYRLKVIDNAGRGLAGATVTIKGTCFPHEGHTPEEGGMVFGDIHACLDRVRQINNENASDWSPTYRPDLTYISGFNGETGIFRMMNDKFFIRVSLPGYHTTERFEQIKPGKWNAQIKILPIKEKTYKH